MLNFALVQATAVADIEVNLQQIRQYTAAAAQAACQVICFPECYLTGYAPEQAAARAIEAKHDALQQVRSIAAAHNIDILMGFMEQAQTQLHITHGLYRPDGTEALYRKTHLGRKEKQFFSPGNLLPVFVLSCGAQIGLQLCVETHYPQITQTLSLRGAQIVFAPHAVPRAAGNRQTIWEKYIPARSYDNRVYMACCNQWDPGTFGGGCLVTGPRGDVLAARFEEGAGLLICEADLHLIYTFRNEASARSAHYYPALRRIELYE